ncbi:MAG: AmmeMemoRadiSam system protein B [Planctomycetota bacterium]
MQTRQPIVAGQFYPGGRDSCVEEINRCLVKEPVSESLPDTIVAGIVPHAGWTFSGALAALVFSAIKKRHEQVDTFVIFGAAHGYLGRRPAVYDTGGWTTPLGKAAVDEELAQSILSGGTAVSDSGAHRSEHSIEVQVPFIQHLFAEAKILPVVVPPTDQAITLGKIVCIGSTDLTHYGPHYGFTPMGAGAEAVKWASDVNDRKFIDLALAMAPDGMLVEAAEHGNACGAGAAAAAVAAAEKLGKTEGVLLAHTNSSEVMRREMHTSSADSVGYAAIVY